MLVSLKFGRRLPNFGAIGNSSTQSGAFETLRDIMIKCLMRYWIGPDPRALSELGHHWFRQWLVGSSVPMHCLKPFWLIVNWTLRDKLQWNSNHQSTQCFICICKCCLRNGGCCCFRGGGGGGGGGVLDHYHINLFGAEAGVFREKSNQYHDCWLPDDARRLALAVQNEWVTVIREEGFQLPLYFQEEQKMQIYSVSNTYGFTPVKAKWSVLRLQHTPFGFLWRQYIVLQCILLILNTRVSVP